MFGKVKVCPGCGRIRSTRTRVCPTCGQWLAPVPPRPLLAALMNRAPALMALIAILALVGVASLIPSAWEQVRDSATAGVLDVLEAAPTATVPPTLTATPTATETPPPTATPEPTPTPVVTTYTVQSGDTLSRIAARFGVTVEAMVNANGLADPGKLSIGQELIIPQ